MGVFGRAGELGGRHGHHMCILLLAAPSSSAAPGFLGFVLKEAATHLTCPASLFFSASRYARRCMGQAPFLPHSCCGSVRTSQSNFMPDLAFWVLGFLGHWKPTGRRSIWGEWVFWSVLENGMLLTPIGVLQAPEPNTLPISLPLFRDKIQFGINIVQGGNSSCFWFSH